MSDIVELVVKFKEYASAGMHNIAANARSYFGYVDDTVSRTQSHLNDLSKPIKLQVDSTGIRDAGDEIGRINEKMTFLQTSAAMFVGGLAERGLEKTLDFAKEQINDVFEGGMDAGKTKAMMNVMAGDQGGAEMYEDIHKYIPASIFGKEQFGFGKDLLASGESIGKIMTDLKQMGDLSMGDMRNFGSEELALQEAIEQGYYNRMQGRILRGTGFVPQQELARKYGGTPDSWLDKLEEKGTGLQLFRKAMELATSEGGRFYHMQQKIAETPWGKKQIMQTNIGMDKEEMGLGLMQSYSQVLDAFKPLVDELPGALEKLTPSIEHLAGSFADLVKWTANNTETIGKWVGMAKLAGEAFIAWKIGTIALTAANWLWVASVGVMETTAVTVAEELTAENAAIIEQTEAVAANQLAWLSMSNVQLAAMDAMAAKSFALPINAAAGATAGAGMLATGFAGAASKAILPVSIMYFAGEAIQQMFPSLQTSIGYDEKGKALDIWDVFGRIEYKHRLAIAHRKGEESGVNPIMNIADFINGNWLAVKKDVNPFFPNVSTGDNKAKAIAAVSTASDAITGGGQKVIKISFKNMIENMNNHFSNSKDALQFTKRELKEVFVEILASADSAIN